MTGDWYRFVALPGSLREGSFTRGLAAVLDELAPDEVEVVVLDRIGEFPHYDDDLRGRGMPVSVVAAARILAAAHAVIVVTPEYNHSIPGVLKNALDWFSRLPDPPFQEKLVAIQSASPGPLGGARAHEHLRQVLVSMNAVVMNKPEIILPHVAGKLDVSCGLLTDAGTRHTIELQLRLLAELAHKRLASAA